MSGWQPLERQWLILRTLMARHFGSTVRELADEFSVSVKTIRRDLNLLRDLGFAIHADGVSGGEHRWRAEKDAQFSQVKFNVSEILALYMSRRLLEPLAGTVVWHSAHSAFQKMKASLDDSKRRYLDQLSQLVHRTSFRDSDYSEKSELLDDLMVGIEDHRITFITYQSARSTEPVTYDVYPYGLIYHRGSLYLVADSRQHDEIRTFKVDRISAVSLESLKFQKPADFDLREYIRHSFGVFHEDHAPKHVIIRFSTDVARYVAEHKWHESQTLTRLPDGAIRVELHLSSFEEVKSWALSFGANAIVEQPTELRDAIREECKAMLADYDMGVSNS